MIHQFKRIYHFTMFKLGWRRSPDLSVFDVADIFAVDDIFAIGE